MKTWNPTENETSHNPKNQKWWIVDATGLSVGRMATEIARVIRGKNKPTFTPNADMGDFVVVINAEKVEMSGSKWTEKKYYRHSRWFGSLKAKSAAEMRESDPAFVIEDAVVGMLPNNKLARRLITKLKAYKGSNHPHGAQRPEALTIKN
jgi:large subunit ribosomal protein L13